MGAEAKEMTNCVETMKQEYGGRLYCMEIALFCYLIYERETVAKAKESYFIRANQMNSFSGGRIVYSKVAPDIEKQCDFFNQRLGEFGLVYKSHGCEKIFFAKK